MSDIPLPSARKNPLIEVFYLKDHSPFICGVHGHVCIDTLERIEKQLEENLEENDGYFPKGNGTYLYEAYYIEAQIGDEGRIELPDYWDLTLMRFQPIEEA